MLCSTYKLMALQIHKLDVETNSNRAQKEAQRHKEE